MDVSVTGRSPDGTVRVSLSRQRGPTVELTPGAFRQHTESSLATAVAAALTDALRTAVREPARATPTGEQRERYVSAVSALAATATSPRGQVTIDWRPAGIDIRIRSGAFKLLGLGEAGLAAEASAAIATAIREYSKRVYQIHRQIYRGGTP
jgi:hypothetical protein